MTTHTPVPPSRPARAVRRALTHIRDQYDGPAGALTAFTGVVTGHGALAGRLIGPRAFDVSGCKTLLDAACGNGRYSKHLLRHADPDATLTAFDLSRGMLRRARRYLKSDQVGYVVADVTRLPFADATFDAAVCGWVLEHFTDPRPALREMARVIAPGGKMLLLTTENTLLGDVCAFLWKCRTYGRRELRYACEDSGLSWYRELWFTGLHRRLGMGGVVVELRRQGGPLMAEVLDWRRMDDVAGFTRFAARALLRGYVVAFPTETGYAACACALRDEAMARLLDVGDRPIELASTAETVRDWLPGLNAVGRRLAKRFWPGPLTLACSQGWAEGLASRLRPGIGDAIHADGVLHLRHPGHDALRLAATWLSGPLAMRSIPAGGGDVLTGRQALSSAGERFNLLIDDGTCRYAQPATVVELKGDGWQLSRPGVVSEELIRQQLATLIVFVCTGNTCRSPMAEAICKKVLAERLKCSVDELPARGYRILSAGMAAAPGMPAAEEALNVARSLGADLSRHASRPLTAELAAQADHLFVMTRGHLRALLGHFGEVPNAALLSPDDEDVDDPIGQSRETYERCARQMQAYVEARVAALTK